MAGLQAPDASPLQAFIASQLQVWGQAAVGDPTLNLIVTGAWTGAVYWCGHTWNLPGDSGANKVGVPSEYLYGQYTHGTYTTKMHRWRHTTGANGSWFDLYRRIFRDGQTYRHYLDVQAVASGGQGLRQSATKNTSGTYLSPTPPIAGYPKVPSASFNKHTYAMTAEWFGSYTRNIGGHNVTFTWSKGAGWP